MGSVSESLEGVYKIPTLENAYKELSMSNAGILEEKLSKLASRENHIHNYSVYRFAIFKSTRLKKGAIDYWTLSEIIHRVTNKLYGRRCRKCNNIATKLAERYIPTEDEVFEASLVP